MKTLHLSIIVILILVGISSTANATSGNLTSNFQPPYPNTANLTMYNPLLFPALQAVSPDLLKKLPPLEQSEHGVMAKDITCSKRLQLIFKAEDGSTVCVKPGTVKKLTERGWGVLEQLVWFEIDPMFCQQTPWDEWVNTHTNSTTIFSGPQPNIVTPYFQALGIKIFDMKTTFVNTTIYKSCDSRYADFFLVSESDADKMIKFGYSERTISLPPNVHSIQ